jgi:hypothetical protein
LSSSLDVSLAQLREGIKASWSFVRFSVTVRVGFSAAVIFTVYV